MLYGWAYIDEDPTSTVWEQHISFNHLIPIQILETKLVDTIRKLRCNYTDEHAIGPPIRTRGRYLIHGCLVEYIETEDAGVGEKIITMRSDEGKGKLAKLAEELGLPKPKKSQTPMSSHPLLDSKSLSEAMIPED